MCSLGVLCTALTSPAAGLILMQWKNTLASLCTKESALCEKLAAFILQNEQFMLQAINEHAATDPFWYQVQLFVAQLEGLYAGYSSAQLEPMSLQQL